MASTLPALKEDRVVFLCGPTGYSVRDIIDAAHFRGEVELRWRELLRRSAAEKHALETGAEAEGSTLDEAAVEFRYRYDLITAEETEAWLEARALSLSDFSDYFSREYWGRAAGSRVQTPDLAFVAASIDQRELLAAELILSGELDRMAMRLAWRVAARATMKSDERHDAALAEEQERFLQRHKLEAPALQDWLAALNRDEAWLDEVIAAECAYHSRCQRVLTPEARSREVNSLRLPLTRLEVETIELESRDAANEALMCVRNDGLSMPEVAEEGRYPYRRKELLLEEIPVELQQKFLSLTPGSILDPTSREDGFVLSRLLAKHEPKVDEPAVRARVDERILARHFADVTSTRVKWQVLPNLSE